MQRPFEGNPVVHDDYDPSKRTASRPVSIQNNLFGAEEPQEFTPSTVPLRLSPNEALAKARSAKFRTYTIVNHTRSSLTEIKTGCTGESGEAQRNVAALQNKIIAERKEKDPLFQVESIDFQGDNMDHINVK